jgi:hypothetical protein
VHRGLTALSVTFVGPLGRRRCRVVADNLDHLDEAEGGPQPAEGRELVIVDLGHTTMMPPFGVGQGRQAERPGVTVKPANAPTATEPAGRGVRLLPTRGAFD